MLEVFGVGGDDEQLYRELLRRGSGTPDDLTTELAAPAIDRVVCQLGALKDLGLVVHDRHNRWQAVPLPEAVRALRARRIAELDAVVASADSAHRRGLAHAEDDNSALQSLIGRKNVQAAMNNISSSAQVEICGFDKPPYVTTRPPTREWLAEHSAEWQALGRGVGVRSVYHPGFDQTRLAEMALFHDQGERARSGDVPMKLVVVDATVALMPSPLSYAAGQETRATLVHDPIMVEALQSLFDAIWHRSLPIDTTNEGIHADPRRDLLVSLLMSGATDVAIAKQMGVTERSVRRWIASLMEDLDVQTRLQLGAALERTETLRTDSRRLSVHEP